jgi:hypothetical protein
MGRRAVLLATVSMDMSPDPPSPDKAADAGTAVRETSSSDNDVFCENVMGFVLG